MTHRILVPFELPDPEPVSRLLVEDLAAMEVVLLGHYSLPEQTSPKAARRQFGEETQAELDALAADFEAAGADVTTRLVFGKDRPKAIDEIAVDENCDAELDPAPTDGIDRILVPLVDAENLERLEDFVAALLEATTTEVTLFHAVEGEEKRGEIEAMLDGARERMVADGFDPDLVDVAVVEGEDHDSAILRLAEEYDAVVMGEADPGIAERIFGSLPDRIADRTGDPVIVVRRNL
ncbi:universal stress protein [Halobacteriales archaeon QS_8_69_26]|nr:MAG: universal stress protein [Halobacteriales archaeon QS_8_69_26]